MRRPDRAVARWAPLRRAGLLARRSLWAACLRHPKLLHPAAAILGGESSAGFDEALETVEELPEDTVLDAVGQAVVTVLSAASGYEIEDGTLYVTVDGGSENALSNCQIVLGAAGALTDDPSVVLRYDSEDVDCSEVS